MDRITGSTKLIGVVGDPVVQVRAPELINPVLAGRDIDAVVVPFEVKAGQTGRFLAGISCVPNIVGLIVTVPHKFDMAIASETMTDRARSAGAVNVMRRQGGQWAGDLLDGVGFVVGMERQGHTLAGQNVLLVGAGGAGTAIALALVAAGVSRLDIRDTDAERALALVRRAGAPASLANDGYRSSDYALVINATPIGLRPDDPLPIEVEHLPSHCIVADIIMKPPVTRLLHEAQQRGLRTHQGHHMLDAQIDLMVSYFFD